MKKQILIVLLFLLVYSVNGLNTRFSWVKGIGGIDTDNIRGIAITSKNEVVVIGVTNSNSLTTDNITISNPNYPSLEMFIAKYDEAGKNLWMKNFYAENSGSSSVAVDPSGNIFMSGALRESVLSIGNINIYNNVNYGHGFLLKFDENGNIIWGKQIAENSYLSNSITNITTDDKGNLYLTGFFQDESIALGSYYLTNYGGVDQDVLVAKYDPDGNVIWAKNLGGDNHDIGKSLTVDKDYNVYITGEFSSSALFFGNTSINNKNAGYRDVFLCKLNSIGNCVWLKDFGSTGDDSGLSVSLSKSDGINLVGYFKGNNITFDAIKLKNNYSGNSKSFISSIDNNGSVLWAKTPGNSGSDDYICSVATDLLGNIYTTGYFSSSSISFDKIKLTNTFSGTQDMFFMKCDSKGIFKYAKNYGGSLTEYGYSIGLDKEKNIYLAGDFSSNMIVFDQLGLINKSSGNYDVFVSKLTLDCSDYTTDSINFCPNSTIKLVAPDGYNSYEWFDNQDVSVGLTQSIDVLKPNNENEYTCKMTDDECTINYKVKLMTYPQNNLIINGNHVFCKGNSTTLTALGGNNYQWNTGETSASIDVSKAGNYQVTTINDYGCTQTATFSVMESELPSADFTVNPGELSTSEPNVTCSVLSPEDGVTYAWDMGDGTALSGNTVNHTYNLNFTTFGFTILLSATNGNGCTSESLKRITVNMDIPNVFTPNGDGVDDVFMENVDLQIIDRYGVVLYKGNEGWDGTYKGTKMKPDTYFYYIKYTDQAGKAYNRTGYVTLIR